MWICVLETVYKIYSAGSRFSYKQSGHTHLSVIIVMIMLMIMMMLIIIRHVSHCLASYSGKSVSDHFTRFLKKKKKKRKKGHTCLEFTMLLSAVAYCSISLPENYDCACAFLSVCFCVCMYVPSLYLPLLVSAYLCLCLSRTESNHSYEACYDKNRAAVFPSLFCQPHLHQVEIKIRCSMAL